APAGGDRALDRGRFLSRDARRRSARRQELFSRLSLPLFYEDRRPRSARPVGLPAYPAAERPCKPAARSAFSFRLALPGHVLEVVLLHSRRFHQPPGLSDIANR